MAELDQLNPAKIAAERALKEMYDCIDRRQNFRLEAGAGAGKTYSLITALKRIVDKEGSDLERRKKQIACITYTNVATDEIISRTDAHPAIHASTIHAFCWGLIKGFQSFMRIKMPNIKEWSEKLEEAGGLGTRWIDYDLGHRSMIDDRLFLHHNDVLALTVEIMKESKFRQILKARYPILFVDEYQDTNKEIAASIVEHFIGPQEGPLIGLFGDGWQKIYGDGCGVIEHDNLRVIGKEANFRSAKEIVHVLNKMRPELPQQVKDLGESGSVAIYHTNNWIGVRRSGPQWLGDLPAEEAHLKLEALRSQLKGQGWDDAPDKTKILMLTHSILAQEQGYPSIAKVFLYNDSFVKKKDPHIAFLIDTVEPVCTAYEAGRYGDMFGAMGVHTIGIRNFGDKRAWAQNMDRLIKVRIAGTIGQVLDLLKETHCPRLPDVVQKRENDLISAKPEELEGADNLAILKGLRDISYSEIRALAGFINEYTPFSTKHGVKGAEFENVLVVLGRGWNHYNWDKFLDMAFTKVPSDKFYERNRNLFYVVCSRPTKRLALLFTQKLSPTALSQLQAWFGKENIYPL